MSGALDVLTIAAVCAGPFFFLARAVGLLRFPDTLTRLHALTKADNDQNCRGTDDGDHTSSTGRT